MLELFLPLTQYQFILIGLMLLVILLSLISMRQTKERMANRASEIDKLFPKGAYLEFKYRRNRMLVAKEIRIMRWQLYHP